MSVSEHTMEIEHLTKDNPAKKSSYQEIYMSAVRIIGLGRRWNEAAENRQKLKILAYYTEKNEEKWWKRVMWIGVIKAFSRIICANQMDRRGKRRKEKAIL